MKNQIVKLSVLVVFVTALGACSSSMYHKVLMKGQIVKVNDGKVMMCIGSREGAKANDEFRVVRSTYSEDDIDYEDADYEIIEVGRIEIVSVVDEHYAIAKVISGDIQRHDIAERTR